MRILVTGHRGYIGSVLVPMLQSHGHEVFGYDTGYFERCLYAGSLSEIPGVIKDIRDIDQFDLHGFDGVAHLAGLSNDPLGDYQPSLTADINEHASVRLARSAKQAGITRFVFASSCSTYGAAGDDFLTEESKFSPVTPYGASKVQVEMAVSALADDDFSPTFLRASTAYGMSPLIRFDLVLNNLTAWAFTTGLVYIKSDGTPWRPIAHVEDICRAYSAVLHAPREIVHNQAFNVGTTAENYRVRDLAEIVADVVPGCRIEYAPDAGPDRRCYRVDCNKIATTLHEFKPQWTAYRGVVQLYETFKKTGLNREEFEGPRYKRIAHIKMLIEEGLLDSSLRWKHTSQPLIEHKD